MTLRTSIKVLVLAMLCAVPMASSGVQVQPVMITNWYSGINDAATLAADTGAGGLTGRYVEWKDTQLKPTDINEVMGLDQEVGVIQYRVVPPLQAHSLFSFNDAFGMGENQIPSNAVITGAKLWLYVTSFASTQTITVAGLSPANRNWAESEACYSYRSGSTPWIGGDFAGAILKTYNTIQNPDRIGWNSIDITEPARDYVTNIIGGVALLSQANEAPFVQNVYFASDQYNLENQTPGMRSTYWLLPYPDRMPATDIWAQKFTANWESVLGVSGVSVTNYILDVATDPRFNHLVGRYSSLDLGNATSCVVTGLTENTTYYYRVHSRLGRVTSFYNPTTLVQTRRLQTLEFPAIASQWVGDELTLQATTESGLAPTFAVSSGPAVLTSGNILSFTATGLVSVVASQAGDASWDPSVPPVTNTFLVYKRSQTVSFQPLGTNRNTSIVYLNATASSGLSPSFEIVDGPGLISSGDVLSFSGTGVVRVAASQSGDAYYLAAEPVINVCDVYGMTTVNTGNTGITLSDLSQLYDGSPHAVSVTTDPAGLDFVVTYNSITNRPVVAGDYDIFVWITNSALYYGTAANVLTINKARPTITNFTPVTDSAFTTADIVPLSAQSSCGLTPVVFSVESGPGTMLSASTLGFTDKGIVKVRASQIGDGNWVSTFQSHTLSVSKTTATVVLTNLNQTYDGTSRIASAGTTPSGLTVQLTYDGSLTAPTNAGSFTVIGTIIDQIYSGAATGTLTVGKGTPAIHFTQIPDQYYTRTVMLAATSDSGQPVTFDLLPGGPGNIAINGSNLTFVSTGVVSVVATDPLGDANWYPACVTNTFAVHDVLVWVTGNNGQLLANGEAQSLVKGTDFGAIGLTTSQTNHFRIGNETESDIAITSWQTNGTGASAFSIVGYTPNIVAGGISNLLIKFTPPDLGVYTAAVVIAHNGPTNNPYTIYLSGTGTTAATLGFVPTSLAFETAYKVDPSAQELVVNNAGEAGALFSCAVTQGSGSWLHVSPMSGTLAGNGSAPLGVQAYVTGLDVGVYHGTVTVYSVQATNSPKSVPVTLTVSQAVASVSLAGMYHVYDGTARTASAWTTPSGKSVVITYDGGSSLPTNVGQYAVTASIQELNYQGSATGIMTVAKDNVLVSLANMDQVYDGSARTATAGTMPTGLAVVVTYDGIGTLPTNAGIYAVSAVINEANYSGSASGNLYVRKALATIFVDSLAHVYDGSNKTATATTLPPGLLVTFTYDGASVLPLNAKAYAVRATINELNYHGSSNTTLVIIKGSQTISFPEIGIKSIMASVTLSATASSGLAVTFGVQEGPGVITNGNILTFTDTNTLVIAANQVGDSNWNAATEVLNVLHAVCPKLFWQFPTGRTYAWLLNANGTLKEGSPVYSGTTDWNINGVGDMDGDGLSDLIWQLPAGRVYCWLMNSNITERTGISVFNRNTDWQVRGVGDIDGDAIADLIWQLPSGKVYCWLMNSNGTARTSMSVFNAVTDWQVRGVGDLDGDGNGDLIWQLPSGQVAYWLMNADGTARSTHLIFNAITPWKVSSVSDLDGDGTTDLIWQLPSGEVVCWLMNPDGTCKQALRMSSTVTEWQVRGSGY